MPKHTNRLIDETSPYLLQHAHNPVDWRPWGDEAFDEARRLGRPVFLSIGYSTCHWCHVMEEESFEDEEIAAFMNAHYVSIKVDREERPDVDAVYMAAVQALTGSGGWPMSVWLTPEREPFFGGTYFPPRDGARGARHGFLTILREVSNSYTSDAERVSRATAALVGAVRSQMEASKAPADALPDKALIGDTINVYKRLFDDRDGGLRRAPKFPSNVPIRLLLRHHARTGDQVALLMVTLTLEKMAGGGMYDQLGGGFHRYSTDARWLVPHFEKMLYDNALLAVAYAEAHQVTGRADFERVARETLDYLLREMTAPDGGLYSATDADSKGPDGKSEEGLFFVWSEAEIRDLLAHDAGDGTNRFIAHYGVTPEGNFEGANILAVVHTPPDEATHAALAPQRAALYAARARRSPPFRDEKILAAWNGLALSAFAVAGRVFGEPRYVDAAARAAAFLLEHMRPAGRLARSHKDGRNGVAGFLDDYAFVCAGLIDLFEATSDRRWLEHAITLADETERLFADPAGGWFMAAADHERLIAREKPAYDGAEPSGTSVALRNVLRLATFTSDDRWRAIAHRALAALAPAMKDNPLALTEALLALDWAAGEPREIAIVWPRDAGADAARPLLDVVRRTFVPSHALATASDADAAGFAKLVPFIADKIAIDGRPTAYVCTQGRCDLPIHDPAALAARLARP